MKAVWKRWNDISLVKRIIVGIITGIALALLAPNAMSWVSNFGSLFVSGLKAVAPVLVLFLVMHAIAGHKPGKTTNMKSILVLYALSTLLAGAVAVIASFIFPTTITLKESAEGLTPPGDILEVFETLLFNILTNPVTAIMEANYIGILAWAVAFGIALKGASAATKSVLENLSDAITKIVTWMISLAPFGIMGLVFETMVTTGVDALAEYGKLLGLLLGVMAFVVFVTNPLLVFLATRQNPYPLTFLTLRESGLTAFFTRSSAANIPVNMELCKKLNLNPDTYTVSIPLGATINMSGAVVTISVLTMTAVHTMGIPVDVGTAILLSVVAAISASGASGVAGGSLLLIPLACSLFGIPNDIAMQMVAVGFIIGVVQDSCETAINSSTDVLFTAAADQAKKRKLAK